MGRRLSRGARPAPRPCGPGPTAADGPSPAPPAPRPWRTLAASVRGTAHVERDVPCQDAWGTAVLRAADGDLFVAVCSDGAGSARLSQVGSQLACDTVIGEASDYVAAGGRADALAPPTLERWCLNVTASLAAEAEAQECTPRDLACTLLVAVVGPTRAVFAQLGDGAIVVRDEAAAGGYAPVVWPQGGEYANMTHFITEPEALARLALVERAAVDEVALFTDGLQLLALTYATQGAHGPFFRPMFAQLRAADPGTPPALRRGLEAFLDSPRLNARTDDDKTLILATRRAPEPPVAAPSAPPAPPAPPTPPAGSPPGSDPAGPPPADAAPASPRGRIIDTVA